MLRKTITTMKTTAGSVTDYYESSNRDFEAPATLFIGVCEFFLPRLQGSGRC